MDGMKHFVFVSGLPHPIEVSEEVAGQVHDALMVPRPHMIDITPLDDDNQRRYVVSADHVAAIVEAPEGKSIFGFIGGD
jgi:hypothetical protein